MPAGILLVEWERKGERIGVKSDYFFLAVKRFKVRSVPLKNKACCES